LRCRDCNSTSTMTRQAPRWIQLCVTALLVLTLHKVECKRFLGIAAIGSRSHQFCMLRVGQELASRGHHFTFLVSDQEDMGLKHLGAKAFPGLEVVEFAGPPDIGTQDWFTRFSRDVMAVGVLLSLATLTLAWHDFHCTRHEMLNVCNADLAFIPGRHDCSSPSLVQ